MAELLVRGLDDDVKKKLVARARRHGRSTVAEVREILRSAVGRQEKPGPGLGTRISARFEDHGLEAALSELRGQAPRPADLDP